MNNTNNEITKCLNDTIKLLKEAENGIDISKTNFYKLCDTPLRHTDTLGKLLGEKLNCVYVKKEPTYFCFNFDDDTELHVSTVEPCIDIFLEHYYTKRDFYWGDDPFHRDACTILEEIRVKIRNLEKLDEKLQYLNAKKARFEEAIAKANQSESVVWKLLSRFQTFRSDDYFKAILEETQAEITAIEEQIKCLPSLQVLKISEHYAEEEVNRIENEMKITLETQKKRLIDYCDKLSEWTDTIRFFNQNGKIVATHKTTDSLSFE